MAIGSILLKAFFGPIQIGKAFGIPVRMSLGFPTCLYVLTAISMLTLGFFGSLCLLLVIGLIFGSVLLHEFGHALAARRCGLDTDEIILMPLGGLASIERIRDPKHELYVVLMGPLVNLMLATIFLLASVLTVDPVSEILYLAYYLNWVLFIFNLFVPAFPMDGGRVLRSSLAIFLDDFQKATLIASWIGRLCGFAMIVYGVYTFPNMLPLIGFFIMIAAKAEVEDISYDEPDDEDDEGFSEDGVLKARNILAAMMWVMNEAQKTGADKECVYGDMMDMTEDLKTLNVLIGGDEDAYLCCLLGNAERLYDAIRPNSNGTSLADNGLRSALRSLRLAMADLDPEYDWEPDGKPDDLDKQIELNRIAIEEHRADIWEFYGDRPCS